MDTGRFRNNMEFYNGFETEAEVELLIVENPDYNLHIWEGYFADILANPSLSGEGWTGFTRDYHQMERTYGAENVVIDIQEYLNDLYNYAKRTFEFEETRACYNLLCNFLKYAETKCNMVKVTWYN